MHCFNHQEIPAVCACASCFKGLCESCMQPSDRQFCCSESCNQRCQQITKLNDATLKIYRLDELGKPGKIGFGQAILHLCIGVPFLGYSIFEVVEYNSIWKTPFWWVMLIIGISFTIFGIKTYKDGPKL